MKVFKKVVMQAGKPKLIKLIKIARGVLDGVIKMYEEDRPYLEISTQLLAAQAALKKINIEFLKLHFTNCVKEIYAQPDNEDNEKNLSEIIGEISKLIKYGKTKSDASKSVGLQATESARLKEPKNIYKYLSLSFS